MEMARCVHSKETETYMKKEKKDKLVMAVGIVVILLISIATSKVNLMDEISGFFMRIWNNGQEAVEEAARVETVSKGSHVEIKNTQVAQVQEYYDVMGESTDKGKALKTLQEIKTLAYHAKKQGIAATGKEVDTCIDKLKKKMKDTDRSRYNSLMKRYDSEKEYWKTMEDAVEEYVIAEKLKDEKRTELKRKKDADVEKELQEYIDEIVGYENFKQQ